MSTLVRIVSSVLALFIGGSIALGALWTPPAYAQPHQPQIPPPVVRNAIDDLEAHPPLVNDERAELRITRTEAAGVIRTINNGGTPIYIVILPSSAGEPVTVTQQVRAGYDKPGTYVSVVGIQYLAASSLFPVRDLMLQAFREQRNNGTAAVLTRFSQMVSDRAGGVIPVRQPVDWFPILLVGGVVVLVFGAYSLYSWRRGDRSPTAASPSTTQT